MFGKSFKNSRYNYFIKYKVKNVFPKCNIYIYIESAKIGDAYFDFLDTICMNRFCEQLKNLCLNMYKQNIYSFIKPVYKIISWIKSMSKIVPVLSYPLMLKTNKKVVYCCFSVIATRTIWRTIKYQSYLCALRSLHRNQSFECIKSKICGP